MRILQAALIVAVVILGSISQVQAASFSETNTELFQSLSKASTPVGWKDPFAAGAASARDLVVEDLQLMGVAVGQANAFALVSGFVVEKGDIIAGFRVHAINRDQVVLKRLDEIYVLSMGGGI